MSNPFYTNSNPFDEDDDNYSSGRRNVNYRRDDPESHEERIQRIMQEIDDSESRQLDSMRRALASIDDSERTGIATAEVIRFIINLYPKEF